MLPGISGFLSSFLGACLVSQGSQKYQFAKNLVCCMHVMFHPGLGSPLQAPDETVHRESGALRWAGSVRGPEQLPVLSTWCGCPQDLGIRARGSTWHSPCGQAQHPAMAVLGPYSGLSGSSSGDLGAFASCCMQALVCVMGAKWHSGLPNITCC